MSALSRSICCSREISASSWAIRLSSSACRARMRPASSSSWARAIDSRWKAAAAAASASRSSGRRCAPIACSLAAFICADARSATSAVAVASADCASASCALASVQRRCSSVASALRISADRFLKRDAWRAWRFRLSIWPSSSPTTSSSRSRFCSAARSLSSASWRRLCRPEMPAASSSSARRACGLAWISSPMRPCPTIEGERAPVDWSANSSCTSLARASLPLMR